MMTLYDKGVHLPLLWTHLVPATLEGKAVHNVQNAMFAAVMAYAMGVKVDNIRQGLRTFDTTYFQAPGRLNVFDELPFKVIMDYAHNPAALKAMAELTEKLGVTGKRILVLGVPGDRRNDDAHEMCAIAAKAFDHVVVRQDDDLRGRGDGELPGLMEAALARSGMKKEAVSIVPDEQQAVEHALKMARRGDLVLVLADKVNRAWRQITKFRDADGGTVRPRPSSNSPRSAPVESDAEPPHATLDGLALVRDERGVRLARIPESED
jgi:cyanophycin synthetase